METIIGDSEPQGARSELFSWSEVPILLSEFMFPVASLLTDWSEGLRLASAFTLSFESDSTEPA